VLMSCLKTDLSWNKNSLSSCVCFAHSFTPTFDLQEILSKYMTNLLLCSCKIWKLSLCECVKTQNPSIVCVEIALIYRLFILHDECLMCLKRAHLIIHLQIKINACCCCYCCCINLISFSIIFEQFSFRKIAILSWSKLTIILTSTIPLNIKHIFSLNDFLMYDLMLTLMILLFRATGHWKFLITAFFWLA
jgi:hypothetical protein